MIKLPSRPIKKDFFLQEDVVEIAKSLVGKILVTQIDDVVSSGLIAETEAYAGVTDRASHAFGGRRTNRTEIMYKEGGRAYIYLCYGMHCLFNVVTNQKDIPHAVLIRGIIPLEGYDRMKNRAKWKSNKLYLPNGPGKVCKSMGITMQMNDKIINNDLLWICESVDNQKNDLIETKRVGVDYAEDDALLPYRFYCQNYMPAAK